MDVLSGELRLFTTNGGTRTRVDVAGEIDIGAAGLLRDHLAMIIESGTGDVDLDMSSVAFCDASGVGVLIATSHQLDVRDRRLRVIDPSDRVSRTFELADVAAALTDRLDPGLPARVR